MKERGGLMETDAAVEKQKTIFPQQLAKRLLAFRTVPTGPAAIRQQTTKPDISFATKTGHFHLLPTRGRKGDLAGAIRCCSSPMTMKRFVVPLVWK